MLVAEVAVCSGLTMVGSLGDATGQQIKLLAIFMPSNLLKKGMVLFSEMMGSCYDTLRNYVPYRDSESCSNACVYASTKVCAC